MINISDIRSGDVFSEESHYRVLDANTKGLKMLHVESQEEVFLSKSYVEKMLSTANQVDTVVKVGKEDKLWTASQIEEATLARTLPSNTTVRVGDVRVKGMKNIFASIYTSKVFSVCFTKQGKELSSKAFAALKSQQLEQALARIDKAKTAKKSLVEATKEAIAEIQANPISNYAPGEERVLEGYKTQFESSNGFYSVVDLKITTDNPIRQVNINSIKWLAIDGVKYELE